MPYVNPPELMIRRLRKREECPECQYTLDVSDGSDSLQGD
jgi:hypothetical protein